MNSLHYYETITTKFLIQSGKIILQTKINELDSQKALLTKSLVIH